MGVLVQLDVKETETRFRIAHAQLHELLQKYDKNSHWCRCVGVHCSLY